jgi:subtilisin family serine protease
MATIRRKSGAPPGPGAQPPAADELAAVARDTRITDAEWRTRLQPHLERQPLESPELRRFLDVFANGKMKFEGAAAAGAAALLRKHGYEVPDRGSGVELDVRVVADGNAAAPDPTFEALCERLGATASRISIAVVDGGFSRHPMLDDNLSADGKTLRAAYGAALGQAFGKRSPDAEREGAIHGTHVAGIATRGTSRIQASLFAVPLATAAEASGEPAPAPVRTPPSRQPLALALEQAAAGGARVVNVSIETFVTPREVAALKKVMERHPDTLFVFGAGNDRYELGSAAEGDKTLVEQLKLPNLAVVGASYPDGGRWGDSNFGAAYVQLAARGHLIASADGDGDGFVVLSGTSMATPNITNLAAKCRILAPALTPAQLIALMMATSDAHPTWKDAAASGGTVNPERAMTAAAAFALVTRGKTPSAALDALEVPAAERPPIERALEALAG